MGAGIAWHRACLELSCRRLSHDDAPKNRELPRRSPHELRPHRASECIDGTGRGPQRAPFRTQGREDRCVSRRQPLRIAVLPARSLVDLQELRVLLSLTHVRLATEAELARLFPESELGAMPPFGNLFGLPVYLDSSLCNEDMIAFSAGTHRDAIHIRLRDFERLERPVVVPFAL
ncbi:MAG: YbaK/EbsC family protein [Bryobacterales bacterium]|nr:YbaK/EbsC family protein [Bryobacterales bacterium]